MLLKWTGSEDDARQGEASAQDSAEKRFGEAPRLTALVVGTGLWMALCLFYVEATSGLGSLGFMLPHEMALILIAVLLPPGFAWLVMLVLRRGHETDRSRAALLEVLSDIAGPDEDAGAKLNAAAMSLRRISQSVEGELGNALARTDELNRRIEEGLQRLDQLSGTATERSGEIRGLLEEASGEQRRILDDLQQLGETARSLSRTEASELAGAVEIASRRAEEIAASLDAKARTASETVNAVSKRAQEIGAAIDQPMARLREESEQTVRRLGNATQELKSRVESLSQEMARTTEQAGQASAGVDDSSARLRQATSDLRGLVSGTGDEVRQKIEELQELVSGSMRASEQAVQRLDQRLGQFSASLDGMNVGAGEAEEALTSAVERISGIVGQFAEQATHAQDIAGETAARTESAAASVMEAGASFGAASRQIEGVGQKLGAAKDDLTATMANLSGVVEEVVSGLEERIREVSSFAEGSAERSGEKLQQVSQQITDAARALSRQLAVVEEQARAGEVQGHASADTLRQRMSELRSLLGDIAGAADDGNARLERLHASGGEVLVTLKAGVSDLDRAIENSSALSSGVMTALRTTAAETESRLGTLGDSLLTRTDEFEQLGQRLAATAERIDNATAERLTAVSERIDQLSETAEQRFGALASDLGDLFEELQQRSATASQSAEAASGRSSAATTALGDAVAELSLLMQDLDASVLRAGEGLKGLGEQAGEITSAVRGGVEDNLLLIENRSNQVTGRMLQTADVVSAAAGDLEEKSAVSLERLSSLRQQAVLEMSEAEVELGSLTALWQERVQLLQTAAGSLSRSAEQLDGETSDRLVAFTARLSEAVATARQTVTELETERGRLNEAQQAASENLTAVFGELELRIGAVASRASDAGEAIGRRIDELDVQMRGAGAASSEAVSQAEADMVRVARVLRELQDVSGGLVQQAADVAVAAQQAVATIASERGGLTSGAEEMIEGLAGSATALAREGDRIGNLLARLRTDTETADAELSMRMGKLEASVRNSADLAQLTAETLLSGTEALVEEARRAAELVDGSASRFTARAEEIRDLSGSAAESVTSASGELEIRFTALRTASEAAEESATDRAEKVAGRMRELAELGENARTSWQSSAQAIEQSAAVSEARSRSALANLDELNAALGAVLPRSVEVESATRSLKEEGQSVAQMLAALEAACLSTISRVAGERNAFADENSRITDQFGSALERLTSLLDEGRARLGAFSTAQTEAADLVESATARVESQLELGRRLADEMQSRGGRLSDLLTERMEKLEAAERSASEAAELLAESLEREQERLQAMRDMAMSDAENFGASVTAALVELKDRALGFTGEIEAFETATQQLRSDVSDAVGQIGSDTRTVTEAGREIARIADETGRSLTDQQETFRNSINQAEAAAGKARKALGEQASAIATASQAATMQSGLAARSLETHANRLEEVARRAVEAAKLLEERDRSARDRRFLTSAAFVAQGLNGLSLDLHRLLDPEQTEANMKRYLAGDRGLFARRLVSRGNRRQIRNAYENDGGFQRHADTYLNEFESVLMAAAEADHEDILTGVFMSADMGKLYMILCDALERTPVQPRKTSRK